MAATADEPPRMAAVSMLCKIIYGVHLRVAVRAMTDTGDFAHLS
jgi:hypothetical protein